MSDTTNPVLELVLINTLKLHWLDGKYAVIKDPNLEVRKVLAGVSLTRCSTASSIIHPGYFPSS